MFGIDLSNHQRLIDLSKKNFDFALIKATEGITFTDPSFKRFASELVERKKPMGCYHFARPDNQSNKSEMVKSADHFIDTLDRQNLIGKVVMVLDWECEPINKVYLATAWLDHVKEVTGVVPFIYASWSHLKEYMPIYSKYHIWAAKWPSFMKFYEWPDKDFIENNMPTPYNWSIWQFTSNGQWPDFKGRVDFDYAQITKSSWENFCIKLQDEESLVSDDMAWAINAGLFRGYSDRSYRQDEPLTRGQLATVLRRYDKLIGRGG